LKTAGKDDCWGEPWQKKKLSFRWDRKKNPPTPKKEKKNKHGQKDEVFGGRKRALEAAKDE